MRTRISLILPLICAPLFLGGCGDDSGSNSPKTEESSKPFAQVDSVDDLPNCIDKREDSLVVIRDSLGGFRCHNKKWVRYDVVSENEEDLLKCSKSREGFVAYVVDDENELYCEEGEWVEENESSSSVESSSSETSSSSKVEQLVSYTTECPAGKTCTYAPTEQLKPDITYGEFLDTRDYQVYKTVTIGTQTWMAQNLNYAYTGVQYSSDGYTSDSTSWCYNNVADSCAKYGRLYTWAAAIDSVALAKDADIPQTCGYVKTCNRLSKEALAANPIQGVCPSGWHLPSYAEWDELRTAVGDSSTAGKALKSASGWKNNVNGTDAYGFSALLAGFRNDDGDFGNAGNSAFFWSSTEYGSYYAYRMNLDYNFESANLDDRNKYYGFSIRCIKND